MPESVTRTEQTVAVYQRLFLKLYRRACAQSGHPEPLTMSAFVAWLDTQRGGWAKRTWWNYKAAVAVGLASLDPLPDVIAAQEELAALTAAPCTGKTCRTSGQKAKRLSLHDLATLCGYLMDTVSPWAPRTARWLIAGHATGLRPIEWATCEWVRGEAPVLRVLNAKATNGRAHGTHRHLRLPDYDEPTLAVIRQHLDDVQAAYRAGKYYTYYDNCRDTLYRATRFCFPKRRRYPTLYSARHQFAADVKREQGALAAAALMGHATTLTSQRAYAQSRVGEARGGSVAPLPRPLTAEMARVREIEPLAAVVARLRAAQAVRATTAAPVEGAEP